MEDIIIKQSKDGHYTLIQGAKSSVECGYDEMLGLLVSLTLPENRPCLQWMRTDFEHDQQKKYFESLKVRNKDES
jgi:hypothetical protein